MTEFNQLLTEILAELKHIRSDLSDHKTDIALMKQIAEQNSKKVAEHAGHIDDLRQAKWKLAGAVAGLSGLASFLGSKLASVFSQGSQPPH